jgi:hypothetical protein
MKISPHDFQALQAALIPVLEAHPDAWSRYKAEGLSEMRFRWDALHASHFNTTPLYRYLNDNNLDTALRKICEPYMTVSAPGQLAWAPLNTPTDFLAFANEVMVPMVAQGGHPGVAKGFQNEIKNLSMKGNKNNMLIDLMSYIEEYLLSYLATSSDNKTHDQVLLAAQHMRSMLE